MGPGAASNTLDTIKMLMATARGKQALFGMQDDKTRWSLTIPLTPEQLAWWQDRMRHTIEHLRRTFPRARLVFRKLHRTDDAVQGTQYITNREYFVDCMSASARSCIDLVLICSSQCEPTA